MTGGHVVYSFSFQATIQFHETITVIAFTLGATHFQVDMSIGEKLSCMWRRNPYSDTSYMWKMLTFQKSLLSVQPKSEV